jgi:hypothetical protein
MSGITWHRLFTLGEPIQGRKKLFLKGGAILGLIKVFVRGAQYVKKKCTTSYMPTFICTPPRPLRGGANFSLSSICTPLGSWRGVRIFPYDPQTIFFVGWGVRFCPKKHKKGPKSLFLHPPLPLAPWNFFRGFSKGDATAPTHPPLPTPLYWDSFYGGGYWVWLVRLYHDHSLLNV